MKTRDLLKLKIELQDLVIGGTMIEDRYAEVCHILKPKNFTDTEQVKYSEVWEIIGEMFSQNKEIDICTVTSEIFLKHGRVDAYAITKMTSRIASAANIQFHSMLILQYDITYKFKSFIDDLILNQTTEGSVSRAALSEVSNETLTPGSDIIETIFKSINYFKSLNMEEKIIILTEQFISDFNYKCLQIKRLPQAEYIFKQLSRVLETPNHQQACNVISKIVKNIYNTKILPDGFTERLVELNNLLK